ncbi:MAG: DUF763 domain-containing protein, partial [Aquificaceae bacterium]|nr:DUF763 domain-containing protein [Aquificaceae bacterium]
MRTGIANLPLHYGSAPPWLFRRMVELSKSILEVMVLEHGRETLLKRLSDPFWFQSLGCLLGFDWHSSGLTTTLCGALKEALKDVGYEIGIYMVGGKGKTALNTPLEIDTISQRVGLNGDRLKDVSRLVAKVDNVLLQDGYQLYHHTLLFTEDGKWCVIQQGMNQKEGYARRYHWLSLQVKSFVEEPHSGISSEKVHERIDLNMVAKESEPVRAAIKDMLKDRKALLEELKRVETLSMPRRHPIREEDVDLKRLRNYVSKMEERDIASFEDVLRIRGVGPRTIRALSLLSELLYGSKPSFKDPARYSFAHGGKDGYPYPVDRKTYDTTIESLKKAIERAKVGEREKLEAIRKL